MMIMKDSKLSKTEYELKAKMYLAYDTTHKLCNIREIEISHLPRLQSKHTYCFTEQMYAYIIDICIHAYTYIDYREGMPSNVK